MLVTFFVMLVIFSMYQIGHQHPESVTNISKLSPTHFVSNIRHQHWPFKNQWLNNLKQRAALSNSKVDFDWNAYLESLNVNFMLFWPWAASTAFALFIDDSFGSNLEPPIDFIKKLTYWPVLNRIKPHSTGKYQWTI